MYADAAPSLQFTEHGASTQLDQSTRTLRGGGFATTNAPGATTAPLSTLLGRPPPGGTARLPVVTSKALARAAANRQLVANDPSATLAAPSWPGTPGTLGSHASAGAGMSQVLVDRMLRDAEQPRLSGAGGSAATSAAAAMARWNPAPYSPATTTSPGSAVSDRRAAPGVAATLSTTALSGAHSVGTASAGRTYGGAATSVSLVGRDTRYARAAAATADHHRRASEVRRLHCLPP